MDGNSRNKVIQNRNRRLNPRLVSMVIGLFCCQKNVSKGGLFFDNASLIFATLFCQNNGIFALFIKYPLCIYPYFKIIIVTNAEIKGKVNFVQGAQGASYKVQGARYNYE